MHTITRSGLFHPVVTDHHHRHSLELVLIEALVIEIVVVIAHASFPTSRLLSGRIGGGPGGSGGAGGVSGGSRGTTGSLKKVNGGGDGELVSYPP